MIIALGFMLSKENDNDKDEWGDPVNVHNWKSIKEALKIPQIYKSFLYFMVSSLLVPKYDDFHYYF